MSDPVAEAAAALAAQSVANMAAQGTSTPFLDQIHPETDTTFAAQVAEAMHNIEAKVDHLIHPEAGSAVPGEALPSGTPADSGTNLGSSGPASTETEAGNVVAAAGAGEPVAGAALADGGDLPNAVSGAAESTTDTGSAPSASGSGETSSIGANSGDPLHMRIAPHLEAIYSMAKEQFEAGPSIALTGGTVLKTHVGDILHRISNGMQVTEGELVQKLEALYRML